MPDLTILQDLLLLLVLALVNALLFIRLRQSPIVGYLVTGLLIGPYGFHLVSSEHEVEVMAEIGVILLLFTIGLEFSFTRLLRLKNLMAKSGTVQVFGTGLLVGLIALAYATAWPTALALGMALALSSTAIVLKLLNERGEVDTAHGRSSLAILLFQDLCAILFLVTLPLLGNGGGSVSLWPVLRAALLLGGLFLFVRHLQPLLIRQVLRARSPELFRLTILALVLGTAWLTSLAGLSLALGAFLAGLALAESDISHQALSDILPFRDAFLALFFISIGMLINLPFLSEAWPVVLLGLLAVAVLKSVIAGGAVLLTGYPLRVALIVGLTLFQVGEFSFILLRQAEAGGLLPDALYQWALAVAALSMMATPLVMGKAGALAAAVTRRRGGLPDATSSAEHRAALSGHVVIAGYGLSGRNVSRVLREENIPYLHLELNGEVVRRARASGEHIQYGDATAPEVLHLVGLERARALVLAVNDPSSLARIISAARDLSRDVFILVRTRFVLETDTLLELGADEVIPDELEASLQLSASLLRRFRVPEGRILRTAALLRQEHYSALRQPLTAPPDLSHYLSTLQGAHIEFLPIPEHSPVAGKSLGELNLRHHTGATVVGYVHGDNITYTVTAGQILQAGDTMILLGGSEELHKVKNLLQG